MIYLVNYQWKLVKMTSEGQLLIESQHQWWSSMISLTGHLVAIQWSFEWKVHVFRKTIMILTIRMIMMVIKLQWLTEIDLNIKLNDIKPSINNNRCCIKMSQSLKKTWII